MKSTFSILTLVMFVCVAPAWAQDADEQEGSAEPAERLTPAQALELDRDALTRHIRAEFHANRAGILEEIARIAREERITFDDGFAKLSAFYAAFELFYTSLNTASKYRYKQELRGYIRDYPDAITPRVLLVETFIRDAWEFRGTGWADSVTEEGWKGFRMNLESAHEHALSALEIEQKDPELYVKLITINRALNASEEDMFRFAREGLRLDPRYLAIPDTLAGFFAPRWGGKPGDVRRIGDWCVDETRDSLGKSLYFFAARKSAEVDGPVSTMREQGFDWNRLVEAHDDFSRYFTNSVYYDSLMALWACLAGDREAAGTRIAALENAHGYVWTDEAKEHWSGWAAGENAPLQRLDIHDAARYGAVDYLERLAAQGADFNVMDPTGKRPLDEAARWREYPVVQFLLSMDLDVEKNKDGLNRAMELAARNGDLGSVRRAVSRGYTFEDARALGYATNGGQLELVQFLVEDAQCDVNGELWRDSRPLYEAAMGGHTEIAAYLLEHGANVNAEVRRETALVAAAKEGHGAIVELLLSHGADLSVNDSGMQSGWYAAQRGYVDVLTPLLAYEQFDVNVQAKGGTTALHMAAHEGMIHCVRLILAHTECDIEVADDDHGTALHIAIGEGHDRVTAVLLEHGANPNALDRRGRTAFELAQSKGKASVIAVLDAYAREE